MKKELHLKVYKDRSELVRPDGEKETFPEGSLSATAADRYKKIAEALRAGYLIDQINKCLNVTETLSINFSTTLLQAL